MDEEVVAEGCGCSLRMSDSCGVEELDDAIDELGSQTGRSGSCWRRKNEGWR